MQSPEPVPDWFLHGVQAALLAPTARTSRSSGSSWRAPWVRATPGRGFYTKIDLARQVPL